MTKFKVVPIAAFIVLLVAAVSVMWGAEIIPARTPSPIASSTPVPTENFPIAVDDSNRGNERDFGPGVEIEYTDELSPEGKWRIQISVTSVSDATLTLTNLQTGKATVLSERAWPGQFVFSHDSSMLAFRDNDYTRIVSLPLKGDGTSVHDYPSTPIIFTLNNDALVIEGVNREGEDSLFLYAISTASETEMATDESYKTEVSAEGTILRYIPDGGESYRWDGMTLLWNDEEGTLYRAEVR